MFFYARGKRQTSGDVIEEKLSVKSSDSGKLDDPHIGKDVEKKLEKPRWLGGELYVSNKEQKRILKNLGAHYKKSMELAQSLLTDIVEIWWRIEDTSKDADPITDGPDSYNLADLLLLAKYDVVLKFNSCCPNNIISELIIKLQGIADYAMKLILYRLLKMKINRNLLAVQMSTKHYRRTKTLS